MRIAAFGRTSWLYESIRACVQAGHEVALIGTCQAAPEYSAGEEDFERLAKELGCPFFCDAQINQSRYLDMAAASGAQAAISVNWLSVIGGQMLGAFPHGIINAHAGDLPRFRGNACPNWAILMGEEKVVLSLHRMIADLDAGPVLAQRCFPLGEQTYIGDVYQFLDEAIPRMFVEVLGGLERGTLSPRPQPTAPALFLRCFPRRPEDGEIDWQRPAADIARLVRASAEPFHGAFSWAEGQKVVIWRARAGELPYRWVGIPGQVAELRAESGEAAILTGAGVLIIEEIELPGIERNRPASLWRSTRLRLGKRYAAWRCAP